jgi:hypothetical protein
VSSAVAAGLITDHLPGYAPMDERGEPRAPRASSIIARPQRRSPTALEGDDDASSPVATGVTGGGEASHRQQTANEGFDVSFDAASSPATTANEDADASSSEAISTDDDDEGNTTEPTSVGSATASTSDSIPITPQAFGDQTDIYAAGDASLLWRRFARGHPIFAKQPFPNVIYPWCCFALTHILKWSFRDKIMPFVTSFVIAIALNSVDFGDTVFRLTIAGHGRPSPNSTARFRPTKSSVTL